jgi:HEAT repeat protein
MIGSRVASILVGVLIGTLTPVSAQAAPLFNLADASTLVFRGTVETVTAYPSAKLTVFRLRAARVLKGQVAVGEPVDLAQEMLFETSKPYFAVGAESLVLAVPLPHYTSFDAALPKGGTFWRWTERLETADDVAVLTDPVLTEGVARYLAVRDDAEACGDFLTGTLTGSNARLRNDALALVNSRHEIAAVLDAGRLQPIAEWLRQSTTPLPERAHVLVGLARAGAPGVRDVAEALAGSDGPMLAPAIDALVTIGHPPDVSRLVGFSKSSDEALRLVSSRGLLKEVSPAALDRLGEMLAHDPSSTVRVAIAQGFGTLPSSERLVKLLADALGDADRSVMSAAAESLARLGTHEAIVALGAALDKGSPQVQTSAAFALKRSNKAEAEHILEVTEDTHPDPKVRRLCKLARGESMHEH